MLSKGLVQIYTGEGKGKTTAALGLALRAAGHGNKVLFFQFLKPESLETGERKTLTAAKLPIHLMALDLPWDMAKSFEDAKLLEQTKAAIHNTCEEIAYMAHKGQYNVIIMDEIVFCVSKGLAKFEDIIKIIETRDPTVELILTGRGASNELIERADLVTEMKAVKHPHGNGIGARKGIEF
ncbi:MAG: cob(I)yrinic acid a,c-diamide adenosyltransferase [Sedimentisphaerales bacterium]|nr:cob(I)yrinic acid a,c-diamide adenosyltransferase [Sedimentisphaerales bacterium]